MSRMHCWVGAATLLFAAGSAGVEVTFSAVAPGVYAFIGETGGRTAQNEGLNANIGLVVTPEGAVLIDSGASRRGAIAIERAMRKVTDRPLKLVINTGTQDHRWLGNGYFLERGVQVVAAAAAQADMRSRGRDQIAALRSVLDGKLDGTEPALPNLWFDRKHVVELGGTVIELHYVGGGHTPGDLFVWLPQQRVVFAGDIIYVDRLLGVLPVTNTKHWLQSFAAIEALDPSLIVPGHGEVTDVAKARRETHAYLHLLRQHMKTAVDGLTDLQTAIGTLDDRAFSYLRNFDELRGPNANRVYLEVERE